MAAVASRAAFGSAFAILVVPSRAEASGKSCVEVSDVVGEQKCSSYGEAWAIERQWPVTFRFGFRYADYSVGDSTFREQFKAKHRPEGYRGYRFPGSALGVSSLSGLGVDGGVGFFVVGQLYTGIDGGLSFGATSTASFQTGDVALSDARGVDVVMFHGGVPVGYRVPLGRASIRGEVLFGLTAVSVAQVVKAEGLPSNISAGTARGLVEPRIAADVWFTQHLSFGAYAGVNMLDYGGRAFGLTFTFHNRAFDGDMSIW